ncbi:MAG: hypothetical protein ACE5EA_08295 [Nitrospirota bacterium]
MCIHTYQRGQQIADSNIALLLEEEIKRKREGTIKAKIAKAKFPFIKTIEQFDFSF